MRRVTDGFDAFRERVAALLVRLVRGDCADRAPSDAVLAILARTQSSTPLARHLPYGTTLKHKPGWMEAIRNDAGILTGAREVVVAAFTREAPTPESAAEAIAALGWCAYRWAGGEASPLPSEGSAAS